MCVSPAPEQAQAASSSHPDLGQVPDGPDAREVTDVLILNLGFEMDPLGVRWRLSLSVANKRLYNGSSIIQLS